MYQYDNREKTNLNVSKERRYDSENSTQDKQWATRIFQLRGGRKERAAQRVLEISKEDEGLENLNVSILKRYEDGKMRASEKGRRANGGPGRRGVRVSSRLQRAVMQQPGTKTKNQ